MLGEVGERVGTCQLARRDDVRARLDHLVSGEAGPSRGGAVVVVDVEAMTRRGTV